MDAMTARHRAGRLHSLPAAVAAAGGLALAACGGSVNGTGTPTAAAASVTPSPTTTTPAPSPTGPATASFTATGSTPALTGALQVGTVQCSLPQLDGTVIRILSNSPGDTNVAVVLLIRATSVVVTESSGSGQQFTSREFTGGGVSNYGDTTGAQVDATLHETSAAGSPAGTLGVVTAVKGTVACGGFSPGSSTLVLTGTTPQGDVAGTPDTVRVTCHVSAANARSITVVGHTHLGSAVALFFVLLSPAQVSAAISAAGGSSHFYVLNGSNLASLGPDGGHVDAVLTEAASRLTLHVTGDVNCGVTDSGP